VPSHVLLITVLAKLSNARAATPQPPLGHVDSWPLPIETDADFNHRVQEASDELRQIPMYDYLVTNRHGELSRAVDQSRSTIVAERLWIHPRQIELP
jgi:hypothetical protein